MNLGEKLKQLRRLRGVTQKELAGNFLTRNMLSQIERGVAMPSYATIALLSKKLRVDPSYFFESSFSLEHYEILSALPQIKRCFSEGQYSLCLRLAEPFREIDSDELLNGLLDNGQTEKASQLYDALRIGDLNLRSHFNARLAASLLNYQRAKELLQQIILSKEDLPFPFLYSVYNDLERYCKATEDYEGAYRCAVAKRRYEFKN